MSKINTLFPVMDKPFDDIIRQKYVLSNEIYQKITQITGVNPSLGGGGAFERYWLRAVDGILIDNPFMDFTNYEVLSVTIPALDDYAYFSLGNRSLNGWFLGGYDRDDFDNNLLLVWRIVDKTKSIIEKIFWTTNQKPIFFNFPYNEIKVNLPTWVNRKEVSLFLLTNPL